MMVLKNGIRIVSLTLLAIHVDPQLSLWTTPSSRWGRILSHQSVASRASSMVAPARRSRAFQPNPWLICAERKQNSTRLK